jgi:hypothetical protein
VKYVWIFRNKFCKEKEHDRLSLAYQEEGVGKKYERNLVLWNNVRRKRENTFLKKPIESCTQTKLYKHCEGLLSNNSGLNLTKQAAYSFKILTCFYQNTPCHIPDECNIISNSRQNFKYQKIFPLRKQCNKKANERSNKEVLWFVHSEY